MKKINLFGDALCRTAAVLCAASMCISAFAADVSAEGFSPADIDFDSIDERIVRINVSPTRGSDPAMGVEIFRGNEVMYENYFGDIDIENGIPAGEDSVFEWGSISKTMVWVSVMQQWERGNLDLDADIRAYLPDGFFRRLSYDDPITMTNLMNHNGGWCENDYSMQTTDENAIPDLETVLRETEPFQVYRPGEVTSYSNWGASLAAYIVERVSGMDYTEYVHKNILEPLGMEHTAVSAAHRDNPWVRSQREKLKTYEYRELSNDGYKCLGSRMVYIKLYPAGSATGTLDDLARYAMSFVDDDAPLFQSKATQEKLFSDTAEVPGFSCGFSVMDYTARVYGHNGATVACLSNMLFDLDSKVGMVTLTSNQGGNAAITYLPNMLFEDMRDRRDKNTDLRSRGEPVTLNGYYINSRGNNAGMLKFYDFLNAVPAADIPSIYRADGKLYQLSDDDSAIVEIKPKTYSDGNSGLSVGQAELVRERAYVPKLCALTAYFLFAVTSVFLLLIKRKMKKAGRLAPYAGSFFINAGQAAKIASVVLMLTAASFALAAENYGMPKAVGVTAGIAQIICTVLYAVSAAASVYGLVKGGTEKASRARYCLNIICNAAAVFVVVLFEIYRF